MSHWSSKLSFYPPPLAFVMQRVMAETGSRLVTCTAVTCCAPMLVVPVVRCTELYSPLWTLLTGCRVNKKLLLIQKETMNHVQVWVNHVQPQLIHSAVHEKKNWFFFFNLSLFLLLERSSVAWKIRQLKIARSDFGCFTLNQLIMLGQQRLNSS